MELRQIRPFLSVAEILHFGRTAELIHLSQPALSLQIRALEEEVDIRLFERNRRKTTLTRVRLREVAGQDFVMYERTYAPGFHDLIFGMLRNARIVPNVSQTAGEIPTLISLVDSGMGITILPASAVKHSAASVVACEILDRIPMFEIGIAVGKRFRTAVVDNFRSFALRKLDHSRNH